ncbi:hypothetical protein [Parasphingorhabdus sp.]|uniref:hypothetical protein n=1 Tax=Parasphingorhabdus sp. TaxID=2709688 RepID=UPI0032635B09
MDQAELSRPAPSNRHAAEDSDDAGEISSIAAGLFGYSIQKGERCSFKPAAGYLREIEQFRHFSPPPSNRFVAQYIESNIDKR